jgi:predicted alpha/beta hydrolase family esterase
MHRSATILTVPGLGGSGPLHWQSIWEKRYGYRRVEQQEWEQPVCADWVHTLDATIRATTGPVVLVGHSLACSTIGFWARQHDTSTIQAALLVAPADTDRPDFPREAVGFAPMPLAPLPFASLVVASSNDEYVTLARATELAQSWGSHLVNMGALGHLNSASGLGEWPQGQALLQELLQRAAKGRAR